MSTGGMFSTVGYSNNKRFSPTVLNTLHGTHDIPHVHHDIPHSTEHPTVLQITPHGTHDIPHGTEHPHGTQDIPHIYRDIPHGTEHPPRYSRYSPMVLMISPTVLNTPHGTDHLHGTAHT